MVRQSNTDVEPSRELLNRLDVMREDGFRANRLKQDVYRDGLKYLYGHQLEGQNIKEGWDRIVVNYIFPAVMQELAYLTQRHQTVMARPVSQDDNEHAKVWQQHLQWLYKHELKMPIKLLRAALDAKICGKFVLYNYWDPHAEWDEDEEKWVGALRSRVVRAQCVATDPEAGDDPHEGRYIVTRRRMPVEDAVTRWPEFKEQIEQARGEVDEKWYLHDLGGTAAPYDETADHTIGRDTSDTSSRLADMLLSSYHHQVQGSAGTPDASGSQYITLEQYWFKDSTTRKRKGKELIPEEELLADNTIAPDPAGGGFIEVATGEPMLIDNWPTRKVETEDIPQFPRGRFILRIGDTILNPEINDQVWRFRRWPFAFGYNQILPHVSEGLNATEMAKNLQDRVNAAERHLMNQVKFFADPVTYFEENVFADGGLPVNRAGAARKLNKGGLSRIRREPGVPVTPGLMGTIASWKADLRDQTGSQEVGIGRQGKGKQTLGEILTLQTQTRLRGAMSNALLDDAVIQHFENLAEQGQRMYSEGDMIRVVGDKNADLVHAIQAGEKSVRFDIGLEIGTSLPYDQDKTRNEAMSLFEVIGLPFLPMLLDAFDREDKDEILEAVEAYQMIQEQLAAQEEAEKGKQTAASAA